MTFKIMYVDDELDVEPMITQKFRREIREKKYSFIFAHNGFEALAKLDENPDVSIILSDINMPEMDGLTLLSRLHELNNPALKTVIVSAYGDMENIRTAMNRGAFDFVTKPIDFNDLEITINKTLEQADLLRRSLQEHDQLVAIQHDLNIAREIQSSILPKDFPAFPDRKEFDIYATMNAAKFIGGDFYDFFLISDDELGFIVGDVSGKGVPAAIFMAVSKTLLKANAMQRLSPDQCLQYVNNLLCQESVDSMFVTVFYGILNLKTGLLTYSNGGHNPPYIISKDRGVVMIEKTGDFVLGGIEDLNYHSKTIQINPGESIFVFSDGVSEAMDINNKQYSEPRLENLLANCVGVEAKEISGRVVADVKLHAEGAEQSDDITTLTLNYFGL